MTNTKPRLSSPQLVERVWAPGDDCGACGEPLEAGDLAVWTDHDGRCHDSCTEESMTTEATSATTNQTS